MKNKKIDKPSIPEWMGNYPFPPDKKKPALIKKDDKVSLIYGLGKHLDSTPMYVSTDRLYFCEYTVPAGAYFDPPDVHTGDECYYCVEGVATLFDPVHGEVFEMNPGDALLIPKGTWHVGFNFGKVNFRIIAFIAPSIWSDASSDDEDAMGLEVEFKGKPVFYKAGK